MDISGNMDVGRTLRLTGDIVFARSSSQPQADDDNVTIEDGQSWAIFFAKLFTSMKDDGIGVFVDPKSFDRNKMIVNKLVFDVCDRPIGYVIDEIIEEYDDGSKTLICGLMLAVNGADGILHLLRNMMIWPILRATDAHCSSCGKRYMYGLPFDWCSHLISGQKQPVANVYVQHLVLTPKKIEQRINDMFIQEDSIVDLHGKPEDVMGSRILREGEAGPNDPQITFLITSDFGISPVIIGPHEMWAGEKIELPLSMAREIIPYNLVLQGKIIPIDHNGSIRDLAPQESGDENG